MDLELRFPAGFADGATRAADWPADVVTLDGGSEVRNQRWTRPLRSYQVPMPHRQADHPDFKAIQTIWEATAGGVHTFKFFDWIDQEWVKVRFDFDLSLTSAAGPWQLLDTIPLKEVRS